MPIIVDLIGLNASKIVLRRLSEKNTDFQRNFCRFAYGFEFGFKSLIISNLPNFYDIQKSSKLFCQNKCTQTKPET